MAQVIIITVKYLLIAGSVRKKRNWSIVIYHRPNILFIIMNDPPVNIDIDVNLFNNIYTDLNANQSNEYYDCLKAKGFKENSRPISITPILAKVYEKFVSHNLSSVCKIYSFVPAAQFTCRKGLGCMDALLTKSHHLQKSLDKGMESYIQLDLSAAFDKESHSGQLFKLKSIGVGGSVLWICREFISNCHQRVVVGGATSEWITNRFWRQTGKCVVSCSVHPLYQWNVLSGEEQTIWMDEWMII